MARGKYVSKKRGTDGPSVQVGRGVGSRASAGSTALPAVASSGRAVNQASEPPPLGIVVMSSWGWRIMAVAVLVALGLSITFLLDGHTVIGAFWVFIAAAWGFFTIKLWRMHLAWDLGR
jgi:hypothetical protein